MLNEGDASERREDRQGLARELARMNLSLNFYTQWYWKADLHNFMNYATTFKALLKEESGTLTLNTCYQQLRALEF